MVAISNNKQVKVELVKALTEEIKNKNWLFCINYKGLNASDMSDLRGKIRQSDAKMIVVKNSLSRLAINEAGFPVTDIAGQNAIIITDNVVDAAKVISEFVESGKIKILYYSDIKRSYDADSLSALAKLPPLEILQAKLLSVLQAPAVQFLRTIKEPSAGLVRALDAYANK